VLSRRPSVYWACSRKSSAVIVPASTDADICFCRDYRGASTVTCNASIAEPNGIGWHRLNVRGQLGGPTYPGYIDRRWLHSSIAPALPNRSNWQEDCSMPTQADARAHERPIRGCGDGSTIQLVGLSIRSVRRLHLPGKLHALVSRRTTCAGILPPMLAHAGRPFLIHGASTWHCTETGTQRRTGTRTDNFSQL
jgi:hypothetical protein